MKITKAEVILLEKELNQTMYISRGGFTKRYHAIIKIYTDEGITGLGEGVGDAFLVKAILEGSYLDRIVGMDPTNIEAMRSTLLDQGVYYERMGSAICAFSAIEIACWDIKGKAYNKPVYDLLGGLCNPVLDTYVSDIYWEEDIDLLQKNALRITDMGFTTVKAHLGREDSRREKVRISALRDVVGEKQLMIDLNAGYSVHEAVRAIDEWKEFGLYWLEEPFTPYMIDELSVLRRKSSMPIAAGENEFGLHGFKNLFEKKAVDVAMPDIARVGGIMETKKICHLAEAYGIMVSPHNFSSGILLAATIHLMASTPNTTLLEYDTSGNAILDELFIKPLEFIDGKLNVPDAPGLGVELDEAIVAKYKIN